MNQGRIWCVVNPTVGLPLFLGTVLVIALLVHYAVLSHTTWFAGYWQGGKHAVATATSGTPSQ
jgi:light-harvesting protein B-800-850 alpha chain